MSKKTIVFKKPKTEAPRRDDGPAAAVAPIDEAAVSRSESRAREVVSASETDRWVQDRELAYSLALAPIALASPAVGSGAKPSLMIDLAGERNLAEVIALSFLAPPLLCWFWSANAITRVWGNLGVNWRAHIWIASAGAAARDA